MPRHEARTYERIPADLFAREDRTIPTSDYFEPDSSSPAAGAVDREMRRQELRRAQTRRFATRAIAVALAGAVVLGGGFAAFGATHHAASKKVVTASAKAHKPAKHKKKPKKS
jgi:predicted anti-sigma-YlaC factor YlaD